MSKSFLRAATLAALAFTSVSARAADAVPPLGPVKLVFIRDLHTFDSFQLDPVPTSDCQTERVTDGIRVTRCAVAPARTLTLRSADGSTATVVLDKLTYWYKSMQTQPDVWHEYDYTGSWTKVVDGVTLSSPVRLLVWHTGSAPEDLRGSISLGKYEVTHPLQGARL